ncbi:hypothetical protein QBC35DRAFT_532128 [Podospora australis]|uniref:CFEM domain-containing protein n=1 Tax=Podospora australis TaxID=1536484 RepID=A0AAN7AGM6_9PEZI|nr:hypothetical protein QBC35DRAFT_532128 [Podospora australis]
MKVSTAIGIAASAATGAASAHGKLLPYGGIPECGRICLDNMIALGPSLGCPGSHPVCICSKADFMYGMRDCTLQSCPPEVVAQAQGASTAFCNIPSSSWGPPASIPPNPNSFSSHSAGKTAYGVAGIFTNSEGRLTTSTLITSVAYASASEFAISSASVAASSVSGVASSLSEAASSVSASASSASEDAMATSIQGKQQSTETIASSTITVAPTKTTTTTTPSATISSDAAVGVNAGVTSGLAVIGTFMALFL